MRAARRTRPAGAAGSLRKSVSLLSERRATKCSVRRGPRRRPIKGRFQFATPSPAARPYRKARPVHCRSCAAADAKAVTWDARCSACSPSIRRPRCSAARRAPSPPPTAPATTSTQSPKSSATDAIASCSRRARESSERELDVWRQHGGGGGATARVRLGVLEGTLQTVSSRATSK